MDGRGNGREMCFGEGGDYPFSESKAVKSLLVEVGALAQGRGRRFPVDRV